MWPALSCCRNWWPVSNRDWIELSPNDSCHYFTLKLEVIFKFSCYSSFSSDWIFHLLNLAAEHTYHLNSYLIFESYYFGKSQLSIGDYSISNTLVSDYFNESVPTGTLRHSDKKQPNYNDSTEVKLWQLQNQFKSFPDSHG